MCKIWLYIRFYWDSFTSLILYLYLFIRVVYPNPLLITYNHITPSYFTFTNVTIYYTMRYTTTLFLFFSYIQHYIICIIVFLCNALMVQHSLHIRITQYCLVILYAVITSFYVYVIKPHRAFTECHSRRCHYTS